ncbi:hypothetical protein, partial [Brachyspira hyodysenteriae]|uniref:hypothetical protein n=1 Tax=Brachyspira hyodysenteriae TaxID=159 RepID=UPI001C909356
MAWLGLAWLGLAWLGLACGNKPIVTIGSINILAYYILNTLYHTILITISSSIPFLYIFIHYYYIIVDLLTQ